MLFYECKVSYERKNSDDIAGKTTETYLVEGINPTDCEKRLIDYIKPYMWGEYEMQQMKKAQYFDLFLGIGEYHYKGKVEMITVKDDGGELRKSVNILLTEDTLSKALSKLIGNLDYLDCEIIGIEKSSIVDVLRVTNEVTTYVDPKFEPGDDPQDDGHLPSPDEEAEEAYQEAALEAESEAKVKNEIVNGLYGFSEAERTDATDRADDVRNHLCTITNGLIEMAKQAGREDYTINQLLRECYNLVGVELNTSDDWESADLHVRKGQYGYLFWSETHGQIDYETTPIVYLYAREQVREEV